MKIVERPYSEADRYRLLQAGVHPVLARLFAARRIRSAEELDYGPARTSIPARRRTVQTRSLISSVSSTTSTDCSDTTSPPGAWATDAGPEGRRHLTG